MSTLAALSSTSHSRSIELNHDSNSRRVAHGSSSDRSTPAGLGNADSDPAQSLRQAALLTLRSKRRKVPADIQTKLPLRSATVDTSAVLLDYGSEEPANATFSPTPASSMPLVSGLPKTLLPPATIAPKSDQEKASPEDVLMREEGEISEDEEPPPPPPALRAAPKIAAPKASRSVFDLHPSAQAATAPPLPLASAVSSSSTSVPSSLPPSPLVKTEPPSPSALSDLRSRHIASSVHVSLSEKLEGLDNNDSVVYIIDPSHVRPGLSSALPFCTLDCKSY